LSNITHLKPGQPFTIYLWTIRKQFGGSINDNPGHIFECGGLDGIILSNFQSKKFEVHMGGKGRFHRQDNHLYEWHQVAVSSDGTHQATVYFDGLPVHKAKLSKPVAFTEKIILGNKKFGGKISDLRIYSTSLDDESINRLYQYDAFLSHPYSDHRSLLLKTIAKP
jgi:hypothetical protein